MLSFQTQGVRLCDGLSRREWLRVGGLSAFGLSTTAMNVAASDASRASLVNMPDHLRRSFGQARACIVLFLLGGPPQHETWDPKPLAPREVRGDFGVIPSATPGLHVGELMPLTARLTDRIAVLRAMATDDNAHSSSGYWMLTGQPHTPKNQENATPGPPNDAPCLAANVRHLRGDYQGLPGAIRLPEEIWNTGRILWPGQDAGWLGDAADPWLITCDPNDKQFQVPDISLPADISLERFAQRRNLLNELNARQIARTNGPAQSRWSGFQEKAIAMLQTDKARQAFDLERETKRTRDRYGRNRFGQSVLLARRLVEAGVSLIQVNWTRWPNDDSVAPVWDTHAKNSERLKNDLMPPMDLAYSALLEDLQQRGLLEETLVVWMGEFGRTPKINARGGRDHWGHVFSAALAGGGTQGGAVYGQSDRQGAYPLDGRTEPQDLAATIYHCLGYTPDTELSDRFGRPLTLSKGKPIEKILI